MSDDFMPEILIGDKVEVNLGDQLLSGVRVKEFSDSLRGFDTKYVKNTVLVRFDIRHHGWPAIVDGREEAGFYRVSRESISGIFLDFEED